MGHTSQRKGRAGELELCRRLKEYGFDVQPGEAVSFGSTPDIVGLPGIHVEVKRHERIEIGAWMEQAERDAGRFGDGWPCVFFRRSREGWRVCMPLEAWIALYKGGDQYDEHGEAAGNAAEEPGRAEAARGGNAAG